MVAPARPLPAIAIGHGKPNLFVESILKILSIRSVYLNDLLYPSCPCGASCSRKVW